jgi:hypothetical protein
MAPAAALAAQPDCSKIPPLWMPLPELSDTAPLLPFSPPSADASDTLPLEAV